MADFDDGKETGALRTIGEVEKATGIKAHVLRYWEAQFPMLKPLKRSGGRRYYRAEDIELVLTIDRLVNKEGYTLKGAKAALKSGHSEMLKDEVAGNAASSDGVASAAPILAPAGAPKLPADLLPRLKSIRDELHAALAAA